MYKLLKLFLIQQINIIFLIVVNFKSLNTTHIIYKLKNILSHNYDFQDETFNYDIECLFA